MFRSLIQILQRSLTQQPLLGSQFSKINSYNNYRKSLLKIEPWTCKCFLTTSTKSSDTNNEDIACLEFDAEDYIVPYNIQREKHLQNSEMIEVLREKFRLTSEDVRKISKDGSFNRLPPNRTILLGVLNILNLEGITKRSILENPWIFAIEKSKLEAKLAILKTLYHRDLNHFVSFLRLNVPRLRKLVSGLNTESSSVPFGNRIYYISEKLHLDPNVVASYLSKRLFILEMPYSMLEQNLEHMIKYEISSHDILRDLWAFRYTPKAVELRLERAKRARKTKIMPWMVRCPESILQRSLQLTLNEAKVLNGKKSVVEYVSERLQFDMQETKSIMDKHPQVYHVRVTKIKKVLDYLLDEAGFTRYEIAQVPRILCHSLETTKKRIDELKSLDCRPSSLVIVCRSNKEYDKFLKSWTSTHQRKKN